LDNSKLAMHQINSKRKMQQIATKYQHRQKSSSASCNVHQNLARVHLFGLGASLRDLAAIRHAREVSVECATLKIILVTRPVLLVLATEVEALQHLPRLDTTKEENCHNDDNTPFPCNTLVLEDNTVQSRNVDDWEDGDETRNDGPEEELVLPDVACPLCPPMVGG